jgi:hypothetical protein
VCLFNTNTKGLLIVNGPKFSNPVMREVLVESVYIILSDIFVHEEFGCRKYLLWNL